MQGKKPKVAVIVQARMGSTRLPGKHLKEVLGRPLISFLFERLRRMQSSDVIILATTVSPKDDPLEEFARQHQIPCFRGSEEDVLGRYLGCAEAYGADIVVRICGDCPLIDPAVVDSVVAPFAHDHGLDFASNVMQRTFPRGMDAEAFTFAALQRADREGRLPEEREHVTPYFYAHPEKFTTRSIAAPADHSGYRWTVDTDDDLRLITRFIEELYPKNPQFTLQDLLEVAAKHPEWGTLNKHVEQKPAMAVADGEYALEIVRPIEEHARMIFAWRNDPETRRASFHTQPKEWHSFYNLFRNEFFRFPSLPPLFVLEGGIPRAILRLEPAESPLSPLRKCVRVSINVAPESRGRGIGRQSLLLAKELLRTQGVDDLLAEVKVDNEASGKAFVAAGFDLHDTVQSAVFDTGEQVSFRRYIARLSTQESYRQRRVYIIAEAGSNWRIGPGEPDFSVARRLIHAAAAAGADAVKFQVFRPETIYVYDAGQSGYLSGAGITEEMRDLFKPLVMPHEMIPQLAMWAGEAGIDFMATPFSEADFAAVDPYVSRHKIGSYEIGFSRLIELAAKSGKPLCLSTGAANESEIAWAVDHYTRSGGCELTLLQCTACYPADPASINLRAIPWLRQRFGVDAGLSDHSLNRLAAPLGAVALGAVVIEKHFTLDRTYKGPDHAYALVPEELAEMVRAVRLLEPMLGSGMKYVHESEEELRHFARRGVQATREIKKGDIFCEGDNIAVLRPGKQKLGVHSLFLPQIEGKAARRDIASGSGLQHGDF